MLRRNPSPLTATNRYRVESRWLRSRDSTDPASAHRSQTVLAPVETVRSYGLITPLTSSTNISMTRSFPQTWSQSQPDLGLRPTFQAPMRLRGCLKCVLTVFTLVPSCVRSVCSPPRHPGQHFALAVNQRGHLFLGRGVVVGCVVYWTSVAGYGRYPDRNLGPSQIQERDLSSWPSGFAGGAPGTLCSTSAR